ncbi:MAG TPA: phospholipid carrier-dependent glycosyltransferase [Candidatus Limnocylindria bacterium]
MTVATEDIGRADRRARLAIAGIVVLGVALRLVVIRAQGFPSDVSTFEAWAERLAQIGPGGFYEPGYFSDYPPGYLYVLWLLGALFDGEFLRLAVKGMSIPGDMAIALMSAALVWRSAGRGAAVLAAAIWMLSPGPIFAGPYWGQVDSVGTVPLMAALVLAGRGRWTSAGVLAGVAAMVKPQFGTGLILIVAAVAFAWIRQGDWRAPLRAIGGAAVAIAVLGLPFHQGPTDLLGLVKTASETYKYTSLFAFNIWSIVGDFWQPDDAYFVPGVILVAIGLLASAAMCWRRRDVATFLAAGTLATFAFYFLPTRAHERYLFPAFALLLPLAVVRARLLLPYVALAISFAVSLYYAFTRYPQNDLRSPQLLEDTLFTRNGQIFIALVMMGLALYIIWRLVRRDATLEPDLQLERRVAVAGEAAPPREWRLPKILELGAPLTKRDILVAFLVALVVLLTRGYRLDEPRDMYFDEVYHARTAMELLAQRDPYEWTHPMLAKEIMALGIVAFGDDRVVATEKPPFTPVAFTVTNDGRRVYADRDGRIAVYDRDGHGGLLTQALAEPRALAFDGGRLYVLTDVELCAIAIPSPADLSGTPRPFERCAPLPAPARTVVGNTSIALSVAAGRAAALTSQGIFIYPALGGPPVTVAQGAVAITAKPDGSVLYALDATGTVHLIDPTSGAETQKLNGRGPGRAMAYALGPDRLFVARSDTPALDVFDLEGNSTETVPLANARTGTFASPATALALVTRTQFLYALADSRVVVVETHGASPFVSIPVSSRDAFLGVDGENDKLVVTGSDVTSDIETGRNAFAWRLPGIVFGAVLAFFLVLLARRLFASPIVAYLVGAIAIIDGSMFAQARIGMNDIYVTAFIVASWYFIVAAHRPRRRAWLDILIAGVLIGLGTAAKWAAVYTLAGIFVACVVVTAYAYERGRAGTGGPLDLLGGRGKNAVFLFLSFAVIPLAIYLGAYLPWFGGPSIPYGWSLWEVTQQMYWYHSSLTSPHCAGAPWWAWPLDLKPTYWYFGASVAGTNGYIYDAGNPVLFWAALPATAIVAGLAIRTRSGSLAILTLALLTQLVAWIPISRVLFFYHFFTVLPFYLLCLAVVLAVMWERQRILVLGFIAAAAVVFLAFYPYVSGVPVPGTLGAAYQILPTWQYDPAFSNTESCPTQISKSIPASLTVGIAWLYEVAALGLAAAIALDVPFVRRALARAGIWR